MKGRELLNMIYSCKILGFTIITLWFPITKHLRILCVDKNMCVSNRSEQNTVKVEKRFSTWNAQKCSDNFYPIHPIMIKRKIVLENVTLKNIAK